MPSEADVPPSACPVDHKTRAAWLDHAKAQRPSPSSSPSPLPVGESCDSSQIDQTPPPPQSKLPFLPTIPRPSTSTRLSQDREISTIPRAPPSSSPSSPSSTSVPPTAAVAAAAAAVSHGAPTPSEPATPQRPANNEHESGASSSGNWIYPSEQMFFEAMRRKQYDPRAEDMRAIVPIHNAVNERAWKEIKEWERGRGGEACGGPRLLSFSGLSSAMTPKARLNTLLGYQAPFDRHDWVVDRCGTKVEYVIDFYAGRDEGKPGKSLNFYLDVRPKLNSWEGWKMRAERLLGL